MSISQLCAVLVETLVGTTAMGTSKVCFGKYFLNDNYVSLLRLFLHSSSLELQYRELRGSNQILEEGKDLLSILSLSMLKEMMNRLMDIMTTENMGNTTQNQRDLLPAP